MSAKSLVNDLRGVAKIAVDASLSVTDIVEAMHQRIASPLQAPQPRTKGLTGLVYRSVRGITQLVGNGLDAAAQVALTAQDALSAVTRSPAEAAPSVSERPSRKRDALISALNGVIGDYLQVTKNPLASPMGVYQNGLPWVQNSESGKEKKWLLLIHGLCMNDHQWSDTATGQDFGQMLAGELGYVPLYLRYNSGRHVSENGRELAALLQTLFKNSGKTKPQISIMAHSMGGLVARSACHYGGLAGHSWLRHLQHLVMLGTPHQGARLERAGNLVDRGLGALRYSAPFARLGQLRSAGITDLRFGSILDSDWQDTDRFAAGLKTTSVPLPSGVKCFAYAASMESEPAPARTRFAGDGLVSIASAHGKHRSAERRLAFPEENQAIGFGMNHFDLLSAPAVASWLKQCLAT